MQSVPFLCAKNVAGRVTDGNEALRSVNLTRVLGLYPHQRSCVLGRKQWRLDCSKDFSLLAASEGNG